MKLFRSLLICLALAVLGALAWQRLANDQGQVIVSLGDTVYVTTVSKALVLLSLALAALAGLLALLRLPFRLWQRRRQRQTQACMGGGLLALHEGRWARAEKLLLKAAAHGPFRAAARLAAAQAAQARGDGDASAAHLAALGEQADAPSVALVRAQQALDAGRSDDALAVLDAVAGATPASPRAQLLRVAALRASHRAGTALPLLGALKAAQVVPAAQWARFEAATSAQALAEAADAHVLADLWERLPAVLQARPDTVAAYAGRAADLGMEDAAASAIAAALQSQWDETLARQYGLLGPARDIAATTRLETAEGWLGAHSDSPALALTLGRLARQLQQWGKAEDCLHRAIAQGAGAEAWEQLGHVHVARHDDAGASRCYANALRALRGEPVTPLERSLREQIFAAAVSEQRDEHGVPRLPQRTSD